MLQEVKGQGEITSPKLWLSETKIFDHLCISSCWKMRFWRDCELEVWVLNGWMQRAEFGTAMVSMFEISPLL